MKFTVQLSLIIGILWLGSLIFLTLTFSPGSDRGPGNLPDLKQISENLNRVGYQTEELKKYTKELRDILELQLKKDDNPDSRILLDKLEVKEENEERAIRSMQCGEPSREYEHIRRKIDNGVVELWYYMTAQLNKLKGKLEPEQKKEVERILENGGHQKRSIITDVFNLSQYDGYEDWRKEEFRDLKNIVQGRLHYLQNPKDCNSAKKIVCNLNKGCGYGCQVHHVAYCMIVAYATQRTLILESKGWRYARGGWETVFQPLSEGCTTRSGEETIRWQDPQKQSFQEAQVVELPIVDGLHPRPHFLPLAIPEDLSQRLLRLHGDPFVWWMGQIMKFIMRPQKDLITELEEAKKRLGFENPIVGIHVRRTDKVGTEAAFHAIGEYMVHVENYYQTLQRRQDVAVKRVYLATDDDSLLPEAKQIYPDYVFISDNDISKSASVNSRYTEHALRGVITDIHFLSRCDFLVCTFSSQVCRVAYELMQDLHYDASAYFHSLDDIYYFGGQNGHNQVALYAHEPQNGDEIAFQPGDLIGVAGNHWDGYSKGTNRRTGTRSGLYPSYKVENKVEIAKMPLYKEADSHRMET